MKIVNKFLLAGSLLVMGCTTIPVVTSTLPTTIPITAMASETNYEPTGVQYKFSPLVDNKTKKQTGLVIEQENGYYVLNEQQKVVGFIGKRADGKYDVLSNDPQHNGRLLGTLKDFPFKSAPPVEAPKK